MAQSYTIKKEWMPTAAGQMYVARAVTDKGRILAVVRVDVPLEVGFDFATYFGSAKLKSEIESAAQEQVRTIADVSP